ncbi:MAG: carboxymuconolactone decarboxylase family protein [Syntrophobacteraceae bacterium]
MRNAFRKVMLIMAVMSLLVNGSLAAAQQQSTTADRRARGEKALGQITGQGGKEVVDGLKDIAPDLAAWILDFAYADVFSRPQLDLRTRELTTVSALTAMGTAAPQLKVHIVGALNVGCKPEEIVETILQMTVYSGFPSAINAINAAREVFKQRNIQYAPAAQNAGDRRQRGEDTLGQITSSTGKDVVKGLQDIAPNLGDWIIDFAYADVLSRPGLDLRSRELATVAALTAMGTAAPQLKVHIGAALNVGCKPEEIVEAVLHMVVYAGFPAGINGINATREVFKQRGIIKN